MLSVAWLRGCTLAARLDAVRKRSCPPLRVCSPTLAAAALSAATSAAISDAASDAGPSVQNAWQHDTLQRGTTRLQPGTTRLQRGTTRLQPGTTRCNAARHDATRRDTMQRSATRLQRGTTRLQRGTTANPASARFTSQCCARSDHCTRESQPQHVTGTDSITFCAYLCRSTGGESGSQPAPTRSRPTASHAARLS
jgi:hypothetical protein